MEIATIANPLADVTSDATEKGISKTLFERLNAYKKKENAAWINISIANNSDICEINPVGSRYPIMFCNKSCAHTEEYISDMLKTKVDVWKVFREPVDYEFSHSVSYAHVVSTNDFLVLDVRTRLKWLGLGIVLVQIAMMVLAITNTYSGPASDLTPTLVFVRFFISAYLGFKIANSFSDPVDCACSSLFNYNKELFEDDKDGDSCLIALRKGFVNVSFGIFLIFAMLLLSIITVFAMAFKVLFYGDTDSSSQFWLFLLIACEYSLIIASVFATIVITRQQSGLVQSIFNFVGLLLILELDDLVASALRYRVREMKIEPVQSSELEDQFFTHKNMIGGIVMVATFIALIA